MRLRFIICRHTLPLTPVVLNIQENLTVAQLLEEVNAVIPLESGEWGLDDYAVELPGDFSHNFECLHYQQIESIMKDDDEVIIRPLSSQDLKFRRVSGRHQISSDGKHLVDGVAFGRQFPRQRPERPDIDIPPRKRVRLEIGGGEDEDEDDMDPLAITHKVPLQRDDSEHGQDSDKQLLLEADLDDDSEDDEDFAPRDDDDDDDDNDDYEDEEEHEPEADEDQHMEPEKGHEEEGEKVEERSQNSTEDSPSHKDQRISPQSNFHKLHSAFPTSPIIVCENVLCANNGDLAQAYDAMAQGFQPAKAKSAITEAEQGSLLISKIRSKSPEVATRELEDSDPELGELDESSDSTDPLLNYYDQNGLPKGSITSGTALSHMAEVLKSSTSRAPQNHKGRVISNNSVRFAEDTLVVEVASTPLLEAGSHIDNSVEENHGEGSTGENMPSSDEDSDSADISETSSSDSDSSDSESNSDSSSDDDVAPEEASSKIAPENYKTSAGDVFSKPAANDRKPVPPGKGRKQTKARNVRRKNAKVLQRLQERGILPIDTTAAEFNKLGIDTSTTKEDAFAALDAVRSSTLPKVDDDFQARRQALLDSLESGGIEVSHESSTKASKSPSVSQGKPIATKDVDEIDEIFKDVTADASALSIPPTAESGDASTPPSRRAKLDLGAGRRLLFGALGIKTPKSKLDEEKIRSDLMKDVRPLVTPRPKESTHPVNDNELDEDPDAWRQSITYRAVECCHDNVKLSEPPFPFVQRWDPQQQSNRTEQRKRKKDLRDDPQYYESKRAPKKQKSSKDKHGYAEEQEYLDGSYEPSFQEDSMVIDYDQDSVVHNSSAENGITSQLLHEMNYTESAGSGEEPTDLAPLPENPTTLPDLEADQIKPGMTIAFKQLIMSEETKWQPQISTYRTAIVIAYPDNGELHLTLALRDRKQAEKYFDEETGDRIYGRFDMPAEDDDEEQLEDDGMLTVGLSELIEPKVVQNAPDSLVLDAATDDITPAVTFPSPAHASTLDKTRETTEDQFSHVTETPLDSELPKSNLSAHIINHSEQESLIREGDLHETESRSSAHKVNARVGGSPPPAPLLGQEAKIVGNDNAATTRTPVNVTETISNETRQEISFIMKEAGFRSSVPPSIQKDVRPMGMTSPGDAAVFEKLMKDMTEFENQFPSSPKFNGFSSSSPTRSIGESAKPTTDILQQFSSPSAPPQSSWQTVPFDEPSSPPARIQKLDMRQEVSDGTGESSEAIDPSDLSTKLPTRKTKKKLHLSQSIQKANVLWKQLSRPTRNESSVASPRHSDKDAQELAAKSRLNASNTQHGNTSVQYPKFSVCSSFTSQISDHGRQPDALFEDNTLQGDITKGITEESSLNHDHDVHQSDDLVSDTEVEPPRHLAKKIHVSKQRRRKTLLDLPSDDEIFPPLEVVLSQHTVLPEESTHVPSRSMDKDDQELNAGDEQSSEEDNYSTPKASPNGPRTSQRSASQPNTKTLGSVARSSQTPVSQRKASEFVIPQGSQVMDLTLSSDADEEPESLGEAHIPVFRRYKMADDDDDDYKDSNESKKGGWMNKRTSSQTEAPRRTGTRLRTSSQASSNPRSSRKKTVSRF